MSIWYGLLLAVGSTMAAETPTNVVWAVNIGGSAHEGIDGTKYVAEESVSGGVIRSLDEVLGSQDPSLYHQFREGNVEIAHPLPNGEYDLTLLFAEPDELAGGQREFDVIAEGRPVFQDLDVMRYRDGKIRSALTVTAPGVAIDDGLLNIRFEVGTGQPILSALVVRNSVPVAPSWELVWNDEFDGAELDETKWNIEKWLPGVVNGEDQAYTARPENVRLEDGHLILEAHREDHGQARYTSARIQSRGKGDFLYGRIEVRARLPRGQGTWPAIWMLPTDAFAYATTCAQGEHRQHGDEGCDAWPNSGEIDIMEHVGYQANHIHGTVHSADFAWVNWQQRKGRVVLDDAADAFHLYAIEWTSNQIRFFVDETVYFTYINEGAGWRSWPFDRPFHLVLNLAIGGMWGKAGGPIDDSALPQQLVVDFVRVFRALP